MNEYLGTPVNPLDPSRVPGGSPSGSAVAVAAGDADLAYASDTGGSIRIPAAFCGITGLKTTHGRIPLAGVWPLAPGMDTIGPMARDVAGVAAGLALLEPGFSLDVAAATRMGRIRPADVDLDPVIDGAVGTARARCGVDVIEVELPGWNSARRTCDLIIDAEAAMSNRTLLVDPAHRDLLAIRPGCLALTTPVNLAGLGATAPVPCHKQPDVSRRRLPVGSRGQWPEHGLLHASLSCTF